MRVFAFTSLLKYYTTWCGHRTSLKWHTFDKVKATHATQVSFGDSPRQDTRVLQNKPKKCTGLYYKCDIVTSRARSSRSGCALSPFGQHYSHFGGIVRGSRVSHGHWSQLPRLGHRHRWVVVADTDYITQMHTHTLQWHIHAHTWMKRCLRTPWRKFSALHKSGSRVCHLWTLSQPVLVYFLSLKVYGSHFGWLERRVGRVWHANNKQMVPLHK